MRPDVPLAWFSLPASRPSHDRPRRGVARSHLAIGEEFTVHTIMVIAGGLALLVACLIVGRFVATASRGALAFLPLWLIGAGLNMWSGVTRAGYPILAELPIFLLVFGVPAVLALCAWRWFRPLYGG